MVITYGGLEFFKVQSGNLTLVFNPVSKNSKQKITPPRFKADIALISLNHADFNGVEGLSGKEDEKGTFVIDGPGEYEVQDVFIKGFVSKSSYDGKENINTIYKVKMEDITLGFLGALGGNNLDDKVLAELDEVNILFVPIGGGGVLSPSEAYKLAVKVSPNIIIPMHYDETSLKKFLKEEGTTKAEETNKLTTKKGLISTKSGEITIVKSSS